MASWSCNLVRQPHSKPFNLFLTTSYPANPNLKSPSPSAVGEGLGERIRLFYLQQNPRNLLHMNQIVASYLHQGIGQ